jgi:hypothetical protein
MDEQVGSGSLGAHREGPAGSIAPWSVPMCSLRPTSRARRPRLGRDTSGGGYEVVELSQVSRPSWDGSDEPSGAPLRCPPPRAPTEGEIVVGSTRTAASACASDGAESVGGAFGSAGAGAGDAGDAGAGDAGATGAACRDACSAQGLGFAAWAYGVGVTSARAMNERGANTPW